MDIRVKPGFEAVSYSRVGIDDFYWLAVPLPEIQKKAEEKSTECFSAGTEELLKCSEYSIKHILCSCLLECDSIVNTASQYFLDHFQQ